MKGQIKDHDLQRSKTTIFFFCDSEVVFFNNMKYFVKSKNHLYFCKWRVAKFEEWFLILHDYYLCIAKHSLKFFVFFNVIFRRKYRQYWQCEQNCSCAQECWHCAANPIESCIGSMMMDCWYEFSESSSDWRSVCEQDSRVWRCPLHRDICLGMRFDYDLITVSNVLFMDLHVYINLSLFFLCLHWQYRQTAQRYLFS